MTDSLANVSCVDCKSIVNYSFVLVAHDGTNTAFMQLASCVNCRKRGDNRSLRNFVEADHDSLVFAMSHKLPVVILGG